MIMMKEEYERILGEEEENADYEVNGATQLSTCCTMCKRGLVRTGQERFENGGSVLGRHPGRGCTGARRCITLVDALPSGHPFSRLIRHSGNGKGQGADIALFRFVWMRHIVLIFYSNSVQSYPRILITL